MTIAITKDLLNKYDVAGPRYTSYPTAVDWTNTINQKNYFTALNNFKTKNKPLSLYLHIPFCESPCYFCACNRVIRTRKAKYGDEFITNLFKEIDLVINKIGKNKTVSLLHWGGGTPNFLEDYQIAKIHTKIAENFNLSNDAEISIEVDSRTLDNSRIGFLKQLGYNRLSMGVQDFDKQVQLAVNRVQSYEEIALLTQDFREHGIKSLNYDLIYGLPYQSIKSFKQTVKEVIKLRPDRIALYNFAYLPKHQPFQKKINPKDLPSADIRVKIFLQARDMLLDNGYDAIAMDHFALKSDEMAKSFASGSLYRNFMGYTLRYTDDFIGFGPSAIGYVGNTFVQNTKLLKNYQIKLNLNTLPVERGLVLSDDDLIRQWVINALMCQFTINKAEFKSMFNVEFNFYFAREQTHIVECQKQGLLDFNDNTMTISEIGKLFIRNICMGFDAYLQKRSPEVKFSNTI